MLDRAERTICLPLDNTIEDQLIDELILLGVLLPELREFIVPLLRLGNDGQLLLDVALLLLLLLLIHLDLEFASSSFCPYLEDIESRSILICRRKQRIRVK